MAQALLLVRDAMPRLPVYVEPNQTVEVVLRTPGRFFLFRPSQAINALILRVLAKALAICDGIQLHAFAFLSNHAHLLMTVTDAQQLARFLCHFKGNVSRGILRLFGVDVRVWSGRTRPVPILDNETLIARFRYILAHGAKEGLVGNPLEWPGVHCARALVGREELSGRWIDRGAQLDDRRRKTPRGEEAFTKDIPITLAPLPCWAELSKEEYRAKCLALLDDIAAENARVHPAPAGAAAVLARSSRSRPSTPSLKGRPIALGARKLVNQYIARLDHFVTVYRVAAAALKSGHPATFPPGSFPPGAPFVPFPRLAAASSCPTASGGVGVT